jgi:alpha-beta hydrolase superfamily lysophospholipase
MAAEGFHAAYPQLPLDAVLNADGQKLLDQVATTCIDGAFAIPFDATRDGPKNPMDDPQWKAAIDANTAGHVAPSAPVLIVHGDADTTVPPQLSPITVGRYCKVGATIALKTYPGADHSSVITASRSDVEAFFADRLAGRPATSDCTA